MTKNYIQIGNFGERLAEQHLIAHNLEILTKNYNTVFGEIDIIAIDQEYLVFVEVKYRNNLKYGHPLESITKNKQHKIKRSAEVFLQKFPKYYQTPIRFDAVAIVNDNIPRLTWLKNAFL